MNAALKAIIRYEHAAHQVSAIRKLIAAALSACPIRRRLEELQDDVNTNAPTIEQLWDGDKVRTHLHEAFQTDAGGPYGDRRPTDGEIEELLGEGGEHACPNCLEAFRLIVQRRDARKEFGIAKRVIRAIGRAAIAKQGAPA